MEEDHPIKCKHSSHCLHSGTYAYVYYAMVLRAFQKCRTYWSFAFAERAGRTDVDLGDGQFSERCDVDGSFFNSDAIPIIFLKSLTSPSSRLFSVTIGNDYFSIILLILGPIILGLFTITNNHPKPPVSTP